MGRRSRERHQSTLRGARIHCRAGGAHERPSSCACFSPTPTCAPATWTRASSNGGCRSGRSPRRGSRVHCGRPAAAARRRRDPCARPWSDGSGWRLGGRAQTVHLLRSGRVETVEVRVSGALTDAGGLDRRCSAGAGIHSRRSTPRPADRRRAHHHLRLQPRRPRDRTRRRRHHDHDQFRAAPAPGR